MQERIILVDDSKDIRDSLLGLLTDYELEVVGLFSSPSDLQAKLDSGDLVDFTFAIVDDRMPNRGDGEKALEIIREINPKAKVMSLSGELQAWGDIKMSKDESSQNIVDAILKA